MEKMIRSNVGIDVSKRTFNASICTRKGETTSFVGSTEFTNTETRIKQLIQWVRKHTTDNTLLQFTMEATGVYHELLAVSLHKLGCKVSVVLPNRVKYYAKSLNVKTKTDSVDARLIAQMGIDQQLDSWSPPAEVYRRLRALTRHMQELKKQKRSAGNHLEALRHSEFSEKMVVDSYRKILLLIDHQIIQCEKEMREVAASDPKLWDKVQKLQSIKGIGFLTVIVVLSETAGFNLFHSRKQLASYAGLDVVERQSGTTVRGKSRISKKGNGHLRRALYLPAIVAAQNNSSLREDYLRIIERKPAKKIGIVAVQRKLLLLMYTLWKSGQVFDPAL